MSAVCNILGDSGVQGKDVAFASKLAWLEQAVACARRTRVHLVIRVHPAEVKLCNQPRRDPVLTDKQRLLTPPADNVTMVGPEDPVNSQRTAPRPAMWGSSIRPKWALRWPAPGSSVLAAAAHSGAGVAPRDPPTPARTGRPWTVSLPAPMRTIRRKEQRYFHMFFFRFRHMIVSLEEPGPSGVHVRPSPGPR